MISRNNIILADKKRELSIEKIQSKLYQGTPPIVNCEDN